MVYLISLNSIMGEVIRYTVRLNPLSMNSSVIVRIGKKVVRIPIDHRQIKFIKNEYPPGSMIALEYEKRWHIRGQSAPPGIDTERLVKNIY
jgi:hypothetical protein